MIIMPLYCTVIKVLEYDVIFTVYWCRFSRSWTAARIAGLMPDGIPHPTVRGVQRQSNLPLLPGQSKFLHGLHRRPTHGENRRSRCFGQSQ